MQEVVKNLLSNCSKSWLLIIFNKTNQLLLLIIEWLVTDLKRKCLLHPLFCKSPLEIIMLFSTALAQLCAVVLYGNRWERETSALSYVLLCFPLDSQQGFHLRTGLYKLWVSASSLTEAAAALDTGFLNQLKKLSALLVIHSTIWGNLLWVKIELLQIRLFNGQSCFSSTVRRFILQKEH